MKTYQEFIAEAAKHEMDIEIVPGWGTTFNVNRGKGRKAETIEAGLSYEDAVKAAKALGGTVPNKPTKVQSGLVSGGDIRIEMDPNDQSQWIVTVDKGTKRIKTGRDWYDDYAAAKTAANSLASIVRQKNPTNKLAAKVMRVKNGKLVDM
ncbi:Hypothetical protein KNT65_gp135 [Escherichia phage EcS1]|uniref:Uncharacterized protein n=1 Tax=Escherichia phage EcS1 TaxID=2083276 RepID=A0A2Z5ZD20_9CAUD|nr:Hypothetical protein KNT65_gp135 [Escherichia phage EcS1]BBC78183.1 Hypothetical protein [Escherichia phage EcS1]